MTPKQPPRRAKKGTIGGKFLLPLPDDMREAIDKYAKREGVSTADWIRWAIVLRKTLGLEFERETDGRWIADFTNAPGAMGYGADQEAALVEALVALAMRRRKLPKAVPR